MSRIRGRFSRWFSSALLAFSVSGCAEESSPVGAPPISTRNEPIGTAQAQSEGRPTTSKSAKRSTTASAGDSNTHKQTSEPKFDTTRMTLKVVFPDPNAASRAYNVGDRIFFAFELTSDLPGDTHATVGYNLMLNQVTYDSQWLKEVDLPLPKGTSRYEGERIVKSTWKPGKYQLEPLAFHYEFFPLEPGQSEQRCVTHKAVAEPVEIVINDPKKKPTR